MAKQNSHRAPAFAWMIPHITEVARGFGYAIGLHGSMNRDLDLLAVPWIAAAMPAEELVEAIRAAVDGEIRLESAGELLPHGRKQWTIYFSGHRFYIDLHVVPRSE